MKQSGSRRLGIARPALNFGLQLTNLSGAEQPEGTVIAWRVQLICSAMEILDDPRRVSEPVPSFVELVPEKRQRLLDLTEKISRLGVLDPNAVRVIKSTTEGWSSKPPMVRLLLLEVLGILDEVASTEATTQG